MVRRKSGAMMSFLNSQGVDQQNDQARRNDATVISPKTKNSALNDLPESHAHSHLKCKRNNFGTLHGKES